MNADPPVPTVALIATARPTFAVDVARDRATAARALLLELGANVIGPTELVMSAEDVERAAAYISGADLVINVCASFSDATPALRLYSSRQSPVLLWSFREPGEVGDRLWLNSLCGANLYGHALVRAGATARLIYGDPSEPEIRQVLQRALQGSLPPAPELPSRQQPRDESGSAERALAGLRGQRIGVIGDPPPGFTPSEFDAGILDSLFGLKVEKMGVDAIFERVRGVTDGDRTTERSAAETAQPSLASLDPAVVDRHAAVTSALSAWSKQRSLSAIAVRCWPEFPTELEVCPCSSLSRLADAGTATVCERDVYGAVTMLLLEALGSGTTYLVDTVEAIEEGNVIRVWHCGSAATALAATPSDATQDVHCNRRMGVAGNFALATGPVILVRLTEDPFKVGISGMRLLLASGESIPAPNRFQGNTADIRLDSPAMPFIHGLVTGGFPHHTVLGWTDVRPQLRRAADLLHIPVIEW